jgi:alpha 1,3-mannosyltransferase
MPESKKRWLQQILPKDRPLSKQVRQSRFWTGESGHMQESGVVIVDKWRHFVALLLVTRMNGPDRNGNEDEGRIGIYDMVYGKPHALEYHHLHADVLMYFLLYIEDKETFWIGWELVGDQDYAFHSGDVGVMGTITDEPLRKKREEDAKNNDEGHDNNEKQQDEDKETETYDKLPPADPSPSNFTICASQLLHLGVDGTSLWFNGWILNNKFAEKRAKKAGAFEAYMSEPGERGDAEEDVWQHIDNNVCCLTSEEKPALFTQAEKGTLEMITGIARDVGAYGKRGKPGRVG